MLKLWHVSLKMNYDKKAKISATLQFIIGCDLDAISLYFFCNLKCVLSLN